MIKLIFGCGYLGLRVAKRWVAAGHRVFAVTRSEDRAEQLSGQGIEPIVADVTRESTLSKLPTAETVLLAVGFDPSAGKTRSEVYVDGLRNVLAHLPEGAGRVLYISTTGVYGQDDGGWVDEESTCQPASEGGRAHLEAERLLAASRLGKNAVILRMAGLYGPGRLPRRADLQAGRPLAVRGEAYLNLIHIDDAAQAVLLAAEMNRPESVYLVSDGHPVRRRDYLQQLARLLDAPPPSLTGPSLTGPSQTDPRQRGATSKRARNTRMLQGLGVRLAYGSYREGLAAILQGEP